MKNLKTWKLMLLYGQKGWWTPLVPRENGATSIRTERLVLPFRMPRGSPRRQCQREIRAKSEMGIDKRRSQMW